MQRPVRRRPRRGDADADIRNSPWYPYLHAYMDWMAYSGYTKATLRTARADLRAFVRWCDSRALTAPSQLSRPVLEQYQRHLFLLRKSDGQPMAVSAQRHMLQYMKGFCRWLVRESFLPSNPASDLVLPKMTRRLPRTILSVEEIDLILAQPDTATPIGLRDRAMIELLYSSGIRRFELAKVAAADLDLRRRLRLGREGKGGKDRYVPVGSRALHWITRYLDEAREELALPGVQNLFVSDYGDEWNDGVLSVYIKRYITQAGIKKPGSCHLFRHAMATHMLENGADIRFIQAILGHAKLTTTEIYTHVSVDKLLQIHAATHPAKMEQGEAQEDESTGEERQTPGIEPDACRQERG